MIHAFLEAGGLIFWILTAIVALVIASEVQNDRSGVATATIVGYIAAIALFTTAGAAGGFLAWLGHNPRYIVYGVVAYLVGAIVWTPIKWRVFFLPKLFEVYDDFKTEWMTQNKVKDLSDDTVKANFLQAARRSIGDINEKRKVSHNKARITAWIAYWPFSIVGTFFGDFLTRVAYSIYRGIGSFLQRLSDGMASKYHELEE